MDRMKNTHIISLDAGGSSHDIRFKTKNGDLISLRNLPDKEEAKKLRSFLHKIDVMAKIIAVSCIVAIAAAAILCIQYVIHVSGSLTHFELIPTCVALIVFGFIYYYAQVIAARYMLKRELAPNTDTDISDVQYRQLFKKLIEFVDISSNTAVNKFINQLYTLACHSESTWDLLQRISDDKVTYMDIEITPDKSPQVIISYKYIDTVGDMLNTCICFHCDIYENMNIKMGRNILDFTDMTFRIGRKTSDQNPWKELKSKLFANGYSAIKGFLGHDFNPEDNEDAIEKQLNDVYDQMPDEEFRKYLNTYDIDDIE